MPDALAESLEEALAGDDEYDVGEDAPFEPPKGLCFRPGCQEPATRWIRGDGGYIGMCDTDAPARFFIADDEQLSWALRKKARAEQVVADAEELRDAERARLDAWFAEVTGKPGRTIETMDRLATEYLVTQRAKDPKVKKVTVPGGAVSHTGSQKLEIDDEEELLAWAKANGMTEIVKETVSKEKLKGLLEKDAGGKLHPVVKGLAVPGVHIDADGKYTVAPSKRYRS